MDSSQQRRCASCGNGLSRYNAGTRCGPCQRGMTIAPGFWDDPQVRTAVAAWDLGTVSLLVRRHTGLSQAAFARALSTDQSEISRMERGQRIVKDRRKVQHWAQVLNFPEQLAGPLPTDASPEGAVAVRPAPEAGLRHLSLPGGQNLAPAMLPSLILEADSFHGSELHLLRTLELTAWAKQPVRTLVIAARTVDGFRREFVTDARYGTRSAPGDPRIRIPAAYEFDDLTYGILWAVNGFDAALLGDDAALADLLPLTAHLDLDPLAAAVRDEDLTQGSLMLIDSQASAQYILDNRRALGDTPVFWTREQTGEEAATWLFFTHKLEYLRSTAPRSPEARGVVGRAFCIPPAAVTRSPGYERVLLLLAIALMESLGITTWITDSTDLADTEGFVLLPHQRAVIASWVRAEGVSRLGRTTSPARLRTFADAIGHAGQRSVTAAEQPGERLAATAEYLGLDWPWLARRCGQLARVGTAALARPRSRLLGLDGLDAACRFIAAQHQPRNR